MSNLNVGKYLRKNKIYGIGILGDGEYSSREKEKHVHSMAEKYKPIIKEDVYKKLLNYRMSVCN